MDVAEFTNVGNRQINEDSCAYAEAGNSCCIAVADGLGGHGYGEIASKLAVDAVMKVFAECADYDTFLEEAASAAQDAILQKEKESPEFFDMRTTLVVLLISNGYAKWLHVGDSRLYLFRAKNKYVVTKDHSVPGMLVKIGEIKENKIRNHPDRNRLLRVLGDTETGLKFEVSERILLEKEDAFLLCTDGFWELIEEKQMIKLRKKAPNAAIWLESMAAEVAKNGRGRNMDNYTAAAVIPSNA